MKDEPYTIIETVGPTMWLSVWRRRTCAQISHTDDLMHLILSETLTQDNGDSNMVALGHVESTQPQPNS